MYPESESPIPANDPPVEDTGVVTRRGQATAQILTFAAAINRELAQQLAESPKLTLSAAVMAFNLLEPSVQVEMLSKARVAHLEALKQPVA